MVPGLQGVRVDVYRFSLEMREALKGWGNRADMRLVERDVTKRRRRLQRGREVKLMQLSLKPMLGSSTAVLERPEFLGEPVSTEPQLAPFGDARVIEMLRLFDDVEEASFRMQILGLRTATQVAKTAQALLEFQVPSEGLDAADGDSAESAYVLATSE